MYSILGLLSGVIIAVMVAVNGELSGTYGVYTAAVIIHLVGVIGAALLCVIRRERITLKSKAPFWAYLGGAIGVLTTLFNNFSFGRISMTSIVALGLMGQSLTALTLDSFGLLGLQKRPLQASTLIGFVPAVIGVVFLLDASVSGAALAFVLSLAAGVTIVVSRTVNARLSAALSPAIGSFINHLVGLPICLALALLLQRPLLNAAWASPVAYLGGLMGVATVLLFNIVVPKLPAFRLTLLTFTGQIFTGILLDVLLGQSFDGKSFWGGLIIAAGLLLNLLLGRSKERKDAKEARYYAHIRAVEREHFDHLLGSGDRSEGKSNGTAEKI